MTEEIREAEIEKIETPKEMEKRSKRDFYVEMVLFLILGVLVGVAVKNEAGKRITIGYDDYKMKLGQQHYNINKLEAELVKKQIESAGEENSDKGATCEQ